jgi:hypothetical protein
MIGSNMTLSPGGSNPPTHPVLKSQPAPTGGRKPAMPRPNPAPAGGREYTGQSSIKAPQYIDINTTEDAVNNMMGAGFQQADARYQTKQLDKGGLSRGKSAQFISGQEGVQAMNAAAEQAAGVRSQDQKTNSQMKSDYEKARELEAQNLSMVQHSQSQSDWARQFANQSAQAQIQMAYQQAQLQLMLALMRRA